MLAGLALAFTLAASPATARGRCVELVGTSDVHGHLVPEERSAGDLEAQQGGLAGFGGYLDILRRHFPGKVLLVDAGDLFQGTVPSNFSRGAAVIAAFNALGYQAAALGNHEFDFGPEPVGGKDRLGALKHRLAEAHFPFLACNVYERKTGRRPRWRDLAPSALVDVGGIEVGLIGAITPDTPRVTVAANVTGLEFHDPADEVIAEAKKLRRRGAELVVLVAHMGGQCTDLSNPDDLSSCVPQSELFSLLQRLPTHTVDAAIGGHTHQYVAQRVNGVAASEAGSYGHSFDWMEACVGEGGAVKVTLHRPVDVCLQEWKEGGCAPRERASGVRPATFLGDAVEPDPSVEAAIDPYLRKVKAAEEALVGVRLASPLRRDRERTSPLGRMIAESIRRALPGAQIGLTNAGGIRADLAAGPLRFGQLFEVLPFENRVAGLRLTGKELTQLVVAPLHAGHGFPQLSGARVEVQGGRDRIVLDDGSPVEADGTYLLATNDFLANGGDGVQAVVERLPPGRRIASATLVRDAFLAYLKSLPQPVEPPRM